MNSEQINDLQNLGYSTLQISQIIKIHQLGIDTSLIYDKENARTLIEKDSEDFRDFRLFLNTLKFNKTQVDNLFICFLKGLDYKLPFNAELKSKKAFYIIELLIELYDKKINFDVSSILNNRYPLSFLKNIREDLLEGIDVNCYLKSEFTISKCQILRLGLKSGVDLTEDLKIFSFLNQYDVDNLVELKKEKFDYKNILKKVKDTQLTLYICQSKKDGIDLLPYTNKNISFNVLCDLKNRLVNKEDISMLKGIPMKSILEIPLYIDIYNKGGNLEKYKNYSANTLDYINYGFDCGLNEMQIEDCIKRSVWTYVTPLMIDCYYYEQPQYLDIFEKLQLYLTPSYVQNIKKLLKYNYENKEYFYDIGSLFFKNEKPISIEELSFYVSLITEHNINEILLKEISNYSLEQAHIIVDSYNDGLDISCMLDTNLSVTQLLSIRNCLKLGLNLSKSERYDSTIKEESRLYKLNLW